MRQRGLQAVPLAAGLVLCACGGGTSTSIGDSPGASHPHVVARTTSSAAPNPPSAGTSSSGPPKIAIDGNGALAAGAGAVWVLEDTGGSQTMLARVNPSSLRVVTTIATGRGAVSVTVGAGAVWVPNHDDGTVTRIDPATNTGQTVAVGRVPWEIGVHGNAVWLVYSNGTLVRLDPRTGRPEGAPYDFGRFAKYRFQAADSAILAGAQALWVYEIGGASFRIPLQNGAPGRPTMFHPAVKIAAAGQTLWVARSNPFTLSHVDADTGRVLRVLHEYVQSLVSAPSGLWISGGDTVVRRDPRTGAQLSTQEAGSPHSEIVLAAGDGRVWAYDISDHTLERVYP